METLGNVVPNRPLFISSTAFDSLSIFNSLLSQDSLSNCVKLNFSLLAVEPNSGQECNLLTLN